MTQTESTLRYCDAEEARAARGLRLVVLAAVPSPWSQAARALADLKGIETRVVRRQVRDEAVDRWTGIHNAPVALYEDEPPRSGWASILALCERLSPDPALVPVDAEARARMFGYSHELMGEGGLLWNTRLMAVDAALASGGAEVYPLPIAKHLAARYGHTPGCLPRSTARACEALAALEAQLARGMVAGGPYYFGEQLTALDIYSAVAVDALAPLPEERCPMHPVVRTALEWTQAQLGEALRPLLLAHRDLMRERHLGTHVEL